VLAAGGSKRLGRPKQLLRRGGNTLLFHTVTLAHRMTPGRVTVVLGAHHQRLRRMLNLPGHSASSVYNRNWQTGMAGSLLLGLGALPAQADAALVLVCDQALINFKDLDRLTSAWRGRPQRPAAAAYNNQLGVPAIIPARYWPSLSALRGDRGAGPWLNAQRYRVTHVNMPRAAFDLDTPSQLAGMRPGLI
jgi:molybdenum cofactor cytidylyltransferase